MFSNRDSADRDHADDSVYERVLGAAFADLHPRLRGYFGPLPSGFVGVGVGRYRRAGLRIPALRPLFSLLGMRRIAFPEHESDVPFTVLNERGPAGTLTATRIFQFSQRTRTMADSMSVTNGRLVDRIGARGEIEVMFAARVCDGRLELESHRLALRLLGVRWPLPPIVRILLQEEAASVGASGGQHVTVTITAPVLGQIYGYDGTFDYALEQFTAGEELANGPSARAAGGATSSIAAPVGDVGGGDELDCEVGRDRPPRWSILRRP